MKSISDKICIYEEAYGFLRELEERILFMKFDEHSWGGEDPDEIAINNLYAMSFLTVLNEHLNKEYVSQIDSFLEKVEALYTSDRRYLIPYILGLFLMYHYSKGERSEVEKKIDELLSRGEKEIKRPSYGVEYLFAISFFCDLLETVFHDVPNSIIEKAQKISQVFSRLYEELSDQSKVKLLYSLAVILRKRLKELYQGYRSDIEDLRDRIRQENIKVFLIKPFMILEIPCNRKILFELVSYFRKNPYGREERKIRQKLSRFFLYGESIDDADVKIQEVKKGNFRISFELSEKSLKSLQRQPLGVPFVCMIGLSLCTAGFKNTYTIPSHEIHEYREFIKSRFTEKYLSVSKKGLSEFISEATDSAYLLMITKGSIVFLISIFAAVIFIMINQSLFAAGSVLILFFLQILASAPKMGEAGLSLFNTLIKKKEHKKRIRQKFKRMLKENGEN